MVPRGARAVIDKRRLKCGDASGVAGWYLGWNSDIEIRRTCPMNYSVRRQLGNHAATKCARAHDPAA